MQISCMIICTHLNELLASLMIIIFLFVLATLVGLSLFFVSFFSCFCLASLQMKKNVGEDGFSLMKAILFVFALIVVENATNLTLI